MLFIGGISQGRKLLNYAKSILCGSCGSTSQCQVFMTYMYFSFSLSRCLSGISAFMCRCPAAVPFMSWSRKSEKLF